MKVNFPHRSQDSKVLQRLLNKGNLVKCIKFFHILSSKDWNVREHFLAGPEAEGSVPLH